MQLPLHNLLKSGVRWRMKMQLEQCRQAMFQLHLSGQQFYRLLTHLGVSHICVMKNSPHFPSDTYMHRKSLYFSYRSKGELQNSVRPRWVKVRPILKIWRYNYVGYQHDERYSFSGCPLQITGKLYSYEYLWLIQMFYCISVMLCISQCHILYNLLEIKLQLLLLLLLLLLLSHREKFWAFAGQHLNLAGTSWF